MKSVSVLAGMLLLLSTGCTVHQSIKYNLDDIPPANAAPFKNFTVSVETLADLRQEISENAVQFANERDTKIDGRRQCINAEKHYQDGTVTHQISSIIAEHLRKKAIFKDVILDNPASADLKLTGAVKRFYGQQDVSTAAQIGGQFGLIGALFTAKVKTQGAIRIELSNLAVVDNHGTVVKKIDDIVELYDGEMPADAYCWQIYWNANDRLKRAVEKLGRELEKASMLEKASI